MLVYVSASLCVLGIAIAQILFKVSASEFSQSGTYLNERGLSFLFLAIVISAAMAVGWLLILRHAELGYVYPLTALAYILVPLGSYLFLGERFGTQYYLGIAVIIIGIIVVIKS